MYEVSKRIEDYTTIRAGNSKDLAEFFSEKSKRLVSFNKAVMPS
jgi:hypothetical protein